MNRKKRELPWYTITLLQTILGAISILMLFAVHFYHEYGIVFWSIIVSWITILLTTTLEISRQERSRQDIIRKKNAKIVELEEQIMGLKQYKD
jgi:hypothetical protein